MTRDRGRVGRSLSDLLAEQDTQYALGLFELVEVLGDPRMWTGIWRRPSKAPNHVLVSRSRHRPRAGPGRPVARQRSGVSRRRRGHGPVADAAGSEIDDGCELPSIVQQEVAVGNVAVEPAVDAVPRCAQRIGPDLPGAVGVDVTFQVVRARWSVCTRYIQPLRLARLNGNADVMHTTWASNVDDRASWCDYLVVTATSKVSGTWPTEWLRGALSVCVLHVIAGGPTYGYAIASALADVGLGSIKGGTLYPLLARLEEAGLLTVEWRAGDGGPGRKFYALTDEGQVAHDRQTADWQDFATLISSFITTSSVVTTASRKDRS